MFSVWVRGDERDEVMLRMLTGKKTKREMSSKTQHLKPTTKDPHII